MKKARELVNHVYRFTGKKEFSRDHSLTDQVRRSAVSVMSNIAEGFERGSNTELKPPAASFRGASILKVGSLSYSLANPRSKLGGMRSLLDSSSSCISLKARQAK